MKIIHSILFLYFFQINLFGQPNSNITIGKIDTIESVVLNEEREIWVHVPYEFENKINEEKTYPVVYLLDGDSNFRSVVGMINQLSSENGNSIIPKMIVVGIINTNRSRDLTPTKGIQSHPYVDSTLMANSGGGRKFLSFIEKELVTFIDSVYPTQPYRILIGHSFGGLTVINTLVHNPELFNSYIAIDPSMWWSEKKLLREIQETKFDKKFSNKKLFLGIANTLSRGMDVATAKRDTTISTEHLRCILELDSILSDSLQYNLSYSAKYYEQDDHGSVPLITEYDGLRFIFDFYKLKLVTQDYLDPEIDILGKIRNHYEKLSKEFGKSIKPDENHINNIAYGYLKRKLYERAESFLKYNISNYPRSFKVYDSIGEYYEEIGDREKAIINYRKSISLNKESFSKEKLIKLQMK